MRTKIVLFLLCISAFATTNARQAFDHDDKSIHASLNESSDTNYVDLTRGLVAFYPFDANANDVSGNHHDGTMNGGTLVLDDCKNLGCRYTGQTETLRFAGTVFQNPVITLGFRIKIIDDNADTILTFKLASMDVLIKIVNHRYQIEISIPGRKTILSDRNGLFEIDPQNPKSDFLTICLHESQLNFKINNKDADSLKLNKILIQSMFPLTMASDVIFTVRGIVDDIRLYNRLLSDTELRYITFGTYRTSPFWRIDSISNVSDKSARIYCGVGFGSTGKDIYRFDLHCDTLPNFYSNPAFSIWTDTSFETNLTNLKPSTIYNLCVTFSHECGEGIGSMVSFTTLPKTKYDSVVDVEGNIYRTLQIGKHKWMLENLRTTRYNDGTPILNITADSEWGAQTIGAYCWYDNNETKYKEDYGALYNYYTVMDNHHICPTNWHVPSPAEWNTIPNKYSWASFNTVNKISYDEKDFIFPNDSAVFGYTEYPAGWRLGLDDQLQSKGMFGGMDGISFLWKSNGDKYPMIYSDIMEITGWYPSFRDGVGIRCIQDDDLTDTTSVSRGGTIAIGLPTNNKDLNEKALEIYPNPATTVLYFHNLTGYAKISIYDLQGKELISGIITDNQVDIGSLEYGIYTIRIQDAGSTIIRKLIKP